MKNDFTTQSRWGLLLVLIIYLGLAMAISQNLHFSLALDEGYHLEYIAFIKQQQRLPISYEERSQITRADFPPLYHLLVTLFSSGVEMTEKPNFKFFWDSFRYRAIDHQIDSVWLINTEDFKPPYLGRFLVWQIGRWSSILLSIATLCIVFLTLQNLPLPCQPGSALGGTALLAFIPTYIILGSALNDDNLLGLFAAFYFLMLVLAIKSPQTWWPFWGAGVSLGLSITVKYTLVLMPLEIFVVCLVLRQRYGLAWRWFWERLAVVGLTSVLACCWWFGWNIWFLNTIAADGWFVGLIRPLVAGGNDQTLNRLGGFFSQGALGQTTLPENIIRGTFLQWLQNTFLSFWGRGGVEGTPISPYAYLFISLMLLLATYGLWSLWRNSSMTSTTVLPIRYWLYFLLFHTTLFTILPILRFVLTRRLSVAAQGRHILIPAAAAIIALLIWGLLQTIPKRWHRVSLTVIVTLFLIWTVSHLSQLWHNALPYLPMRTVAQAAEVLTHPMNARFGEVAELVSYDVQVEADKASVQVELAWRALAHAPESDQLLITVTDSNGQPVSHWLGHHGHGRLPTLAWEPGDVIFDRLALPLPNLPPDIYTLHIELIGRAGRLPVQHHTASADHPLTLSRFTLDQPTRLNLSERTGSPTLLQFATWQADGPIALANQPVYRYPGTISFITPPDTTVTLTAPDGHIWAATHATDQIHTFVIGPRWVSGNYAIQFETIDGTTGVATWPVIIENWWPRQFEPPEIANPVEANFANQLLFLGYNLPEKQVKAGEAFPLTLYWQALPDKPPQADFIQFNNLFDHRGTPHGGYDRYPLEYYNTLLWAAGEVVIDGYAVPVDAAAPPGDYYLDVGYYLIVGESAVNLPLVVEGQMTDVSRVTIGPIEVVTD